MPAGKTVNFEYDSGRYPKTLQSWDTTNAEYGRFDYTKRVPLVEGTSHYVYLGPPNVEFGRRAQRTIDEGLGDFNLRKSTYVDEISDHAIRNYTRTSQKHGLEYEGVENLNLNPSTALDRSKYYAAPMTQRVQNSTLGQMVGTGAPPTASTYLSPPRPPPAAEYLHTCCPGLHASMAALS